MSVPLNDPRGLFWFGSKSDGSPCAGWTPPLMDDEFVSVTAWLDVLRDVQDKFSDVNLLSVKQMTRSQFENFLAASQMVEIGA